MPRASSSPSSFSPPRAGRSAPLWRAWFALRRSPHVGRLVPRSRNPHQDSLLLAVLVFVIPLLGVRLIQSRRFFRLALAAFCLTATLALGFYATFVGGALLGLLGSIHAFGVAEYLQTRAPASRPVVRTLRRTGLVLAFSIATTLLAPRLLAPLVVPVGSPEGVVLCNPLADSPPFPPGTTLAFRLPGAIHQGVLLRSGTYLGTVLALPGDEVVFTAEALLVNGRPGPRLPLMPDSGRLLVPADRAFVWPTSFSVRSGRASFARLLPETLLVPRSDLVGRPYHRWFWRRQDP